MEYFILKKFYELEVQIEKKPVPDDHEKLLLKSSRSHNFIDPKKNQNHG